MAGKSNIEWTGHTWNPLAGCTVLTPGCKRCYAMKLAARLESMGQPLYKGLTTKVNGNAVWTGEMRQAPEYTLLDPIRRKRPTTYFVNSMSDMFHEGVPDEWIDRIFAVMALTPRHTYQVLTKRAARMKAWFAPFDSRRADSLGKMVLELGYTGHLESLPWPLPNVWLGVSTERQQEANERIPLLLETPAAVRFISAEPLLGPIQLRPLGCGTNALSSSTGPNLGWVIVGGESGHGYRDMSPDWARDIRDQCIAAGVPVFIKQMAGRKPIPEDLLVRQFPPATTIERTIV